MSPITLNPGQTEAQEMLLRYLEHCQTHRVPPRRAGGPRPPPVAQPPAYLWGYAGTGKTLLVSELLRRPEYRGLRICVAAPTHAALDVLIKSVCRDSLLLAEQFEFMTLHRALNIRPSIDVATGERCFTLQSGSRRQLPYDLILIDESSMLTAEMVAYLAGLESRPHIIYLGDSAQLNPVNQAISPIFQQSVGSPWRAELTEIMRTASDDIKQISAFIRHCRPLHLGRILREINRLKSQSSTRELSVYRLSYAHPEQSRWYRDLARCRRAEDLPVFLAWRNCRVDYYNRVIRRRLHGDGVTEDPVPGDRVRWNDYYKYQETVLEEEVPVEELESQPRVIYPGDKSVILAVGEPREVEINPWSGSRRSGTAGSELALRVAQVRRRLARQEITCQMLPVTLRQSDGTEVAVETVCAGDREAYDQMVVEMSRLIRAFHARSGSEKTTQGLWTQLYSQTRDRYPTFSWGYSTTVHKAQGTTYPVVYLDYSDMALNTNADELRAELYTAVTRASDRVVFLCEE